MRKRWAGILVVAVFLGLLGFTIFYASKPKPEDSKKVVFEIQKQNILQLDINSDVSYTIKRAADSYEILIPEKAPALKNAVDGIFDSASKIEYISIVDENAQDIAQFGFTKPSTSLKISLSDGTTKTFQIGNQTPIEDGYYLREENKNKIYKISDATAGKFLQKLDTLIEKKIVLTGINDLNKIVLNYLNKEYTIQNINGIWKHNEKELNKDKMNSLYNEARGFVADGLAKKEEYVKLDTTADIKITLYLNDTSMQNISVIKRNAENYNIIKEGIDVQYNLSKVSFDKYYNDILVYINELLK